MLNGTEAHSKIINRTVSKKFDGFEEPFVGKIMRMEFDEESHLTWFTVQWSDGDEEDGHYLEIRDWLVPGE
jgi:hypothetical protein